MLSNNTVCQVTNSETPNLHKNPESVNSSDKIKTFVNSKTSNPSEMLTGSWGWFWKVRDQRRSPPFARSGKMQKRAFFFLERYRSKSEKRYIGLGRMSWSTISPDVVCFDSGKSSLSGYQMVCRSSQGLGLSLDAPCESKSLFPRVWWHKSSLAVPYKGLSSKVKESFSSGAISNRQYLQFERCDA